MGQTVPIRTRHRDHGQVWTTWHTADWPEAAGRERLQAGGPVDEWNVGDSCKVGPFRVYLKARRLLPSTARRYRWRQWLTRRPLPRLAEWHHLAWLRRHLFDAPRPLAAGTVTQAGRVRAQWIATEWMEGWVPWESHWTSLSEAARAVRARQLGGTLARLHALDFVHGDLFERNLLVEPGTSPLGAAPAEAVEVPIALLDCWSGGPNGHRRGEAYDLACLSLAWPEAWTPAQQTTLLQAYREGRSQQGRPIRHWAGFLKRVAKARATRWAREARRGERYGSSAAQHWSPPDAAL